MPTYNDFKEFYQDFKGDKIVMIILRVTFGSLALVFVLAIGIFIHHAAKGKPAKLLFGIAEINTVKTDTIYKMVASPKDTVYKEIIRYIPNPISLSSGSKAVAGLKSSNDVKSTGPKAHIVSGTGNQVGVNGDQYVGIKQRHLDSEVWQYILKNIPNKAEEIQFLFAGGKEGLNYANEIYNALLNSGYTNVKPSNWMDPDAFDKVYIKREGQNPVSLRVCPASNVQ